MRTRAKVVIGLAAVLVVLGTVGAVAGPILYRDVFAAPPAAAPTLQAEDSSMLTAPGDPLEPTALSGEWSIAAGSESGYRVNEVLNGTPVTVTGRTDKVGGSMSVDGLTLTAARLTVDVASIATDSGSRDQYFRESVMRAGEFPTATFTLTAPATAAAVPAAGETVEVTLAGDLTIAGVTRPVSFAAHARTDGTTAEIAGSIPISFAEFGVTAPNLGFVSVDDHGFVEFQLIATRG